MARRLNVLATTLSLAILIAPREYAQNLNQREGIRRVLLISVDGMHALDYENCVSGERSTAQARTDDAHAAIILYFVIVQTLRRRRPPRFRHSEIPA